MAPFLLCWMHLGVNKNYWDWVHYAFVFEYGPTNLTRFVRTYVNGVLMWSDYESVGAGPASEVCPTEEAVRPIWTAPAEMGLYLCHHHRSPVEYPIDKWYPSYHRGLLDEVRIWSTARSQTEIRANMNTALNGTEPGLMVYYNFDEMASDYELQKLGGTTAFSMQAKDGVSGAKSLVFGRCPFGLNCAGVTEAQTTQPTLVPSDAPIGRGTLLIEVAAGTNQTLIKLPGSDADGDILRWRLTTVPQANYGTLTNTTGAAMSASVLFDNPQLLYTTKPAVGGNPVDTFTYVVNDGLLDSLSVTVKINVKCEPGRFLDNQQKACVVAPAGSFTKNYNYDTTPTPCPAGFFQNAVGSRLCFPCVRATDATRLKVVLPLNLSQVWDTYPGMSAVSQSLYAAPSGTYSAQAGATTCTPCPTGTHAEVDGATTCTADPPIVVAVALSNKDMPVMVLLAAVGVTTVGIIVTLMIFLAKRKHPQVVRASLLFCICILLGLLLALLSAVALMQQPSNLICLAQIWLPGIAMGMTMGPIIAKTYRVYRIFNNTKLLQLRMQDRDVLLWAISLIPAELVRNVFFSWWHWEG